MKTACVCLDTTAEGCMIQGDGQEEILTMLDEAKELWLETALEECIPILKPTGATSS
jgi:predicted RNase H-like HicB family nuclease